MNSPATPGDAEALSPAPTPDAPDAPDAPVEPSAAGTAATPAKAEPPKKGRIARIYDFFTTRPESEWLRALFDHGPIVALLVIAVGLRVYRLAEVAGSLIGDEVWYVQASRVIAGVPVLMHHLPAKTFSGLDPNSEHPPLAKVVMAAMMKHYGDKEVVWRAPSVVLGVASIWLLYRIIMQLGGTRWQANLGAFIVTFDNLFLIHGRIATLDIYLVAFTLVGTWLYLAGLLELAAFAFAIATLCKTNAILGLGAMFLYEAVLHLKDWRLLFTRQALRPIGRRALVVALYLGFFLLGLGALDCYYTEYRTPFAHLNHMIHFHAGLTHTGPSSGSESTPFEWFLNLGAFDYFTWTGTAHGAPQHLVFRCTLNYYVLFVAQLTMIYVAKEMWTKREPLTTFAITSFVASFGPIFLFWAIWSRTSYIYYMLPSIPAFACAIVAGAKAVPTYMRWGFVGLVLYGFAYSYPVRLF
jgi:predicted membrane-bound dolichyl-phosphate-mannose-protein mannosyltransferase